MPTRLAWLLTGPLGHLAAGVVDWAALLARFARGRARSAAARRRRSRAPPGDPDRAG